MLNNIEALAQIRKITGEVLKLNLHEEILRIKVSDNKVAVQIQTYRLREQQYTHKVEAVGKKLVVFEKDACGEWTVDSLTTWHDNPEVTFIRHAGRGKTPQEYREQKIWEDSCYRPGTAKSPMDNVPVQAYLRNA